jgi:hypothetical protein
MAEFNACVNKLRTANLPGVADRRLILIYESQPPGSSQHSFSASSNDLAPSAELSQVYPLAADPLAARMLRPRWTEAPTVSTDGLGGL